MSRLVFLVMALAAITVGLLQPEDQSPQAQRASIRATLERHGYVASGQVAMGRAVAIAKFSSADCDNIRVLPVSIQFQETALLRTSENTQDQRIFVYRGQAWMETASNRAALAHLAEKFRQMTRLRPAPAVDTMLYIVLPKACRAPRIDWSRFWAPQAI